MAEPAADTVISLITSPADLGEAIRRARLALGLNYRDAAARCRVGRRFFNEIENGKPTARLDKVLAVMTGMGLLAIVVPLEEAMKAFAKQ